MKATGCGSPAAAEEHAGPAGPDSADPGHGRLLQLGLRQAALQRGGAGGEAGAAPPGPPTEGLAAGASRQCLLQVRGPIIRSTKSNITKRFVIILIRKRIFVYSYWYVLSVVIDF